MACNVEFEQEIPQEFADRLSPPKTGWKGKL